MAASNWQAKKFTSLKALEGVFAFRRGRAFEGYQELVELDGGGLARLLLAGQITGFDVVKWGPQIEADLKRMKYRVQMLDKELDNCKRELRAKGFTYA